MCVRVSVYVCKDSLFIAVVVKVTLFIYDLPKVAIKKQTKKNSISTLRHTLSDNHEHLFWYDGHACSDEQAGDDYEDAHL